MAARIHSCCDNSQSSVCNFSVDGCDVDSVLLQIESICNTGDNRESYRSMRMFLKAVLPRDCRNAIQHRMAEALRQGSLSE